MSGLRPRAQRRWRHEFLPLFAAFAFPLALASVFPFGALFPTRPVPASPEADLQFHERHGVLHVGAAYVTPAACAFVELTAAEEEQVLAAARAAWQTDAGNLPRKGPEMFAEALPDDPARPLLGVSARTRTETAVPPFVPSALPTDFRASAPVVFPDLPALPAAPPAFPRSELLKLE